MFQNAPPQRYKEGFASPGPSLGDANVADPLSALAATAEASGKPVVFIDAGVEDANAVIAEHGAISKVHVLEADSNDVSQMAKLTVSNGSSVTGDTGPASSHAQQHSLVGQTNPQRTYCICGGDDTAHSVGGDDTVDGGAGADIVEVQFTLKLAPTQVQEPRQAHQILRGAAPRAPETFNTLDITLRPPWNDGHRKGP